MDWANAWQVQGETKGECASNEVMCEYLCACEWPVPQKKITQGNEKRNMMAEELRNNRRVKKEQEAGWESSAGLACSFFSVAYKWLSYYWNTATAVPSIVIYKCHSLLILWVQHKWHYLFLYPFSALSSCLNQKVFFIKYKPSQLPLCLWKHWKTLGEITWNLRSWCVNFSSRNS